RLRTLGTSVGSPARTIPGPTSCTDHRLSREGRGQRLSRSELRRGRLQGSGEGQVRRCCRKGRRQGADRPDRSSGRLAEQEFRLANGTRIVRKKGVAFFRYEDRVGGADVIFGERTVTRRTYLRALHVSSSNPFAAARAADHGGRPAVLPEFAGDLADFAGSRCAP